MSQIEKAHIQGWEALRRATGNQTVAFRGGLPLDCLIDETGGAYSGRRSPDLSTRLGIVVEVLISDLPEAPRVGEYMTASDGRSLRIVTVERRALWWRLTCQPKE